MLSGSRTKCLHNISGCLLYEENGKCIKCNSSTIITQNSWNCSNPIDNCQKYFDNNTCLTCVNNTVPINNFFVSINKTLCASQIVDCSQYYDTQTCFQCTNSKVLSFTNKSCVPPITDCSNYSDNGFCLVCAKSKQLTNDQTACVNPIVNCTSISVQDLCIQCVNGQIPSYNQTACVFSIPSCLKETDDNKCLSCLLGTPTTNQTKCQANSSSTQAIQSKIETAPTNNSAKNTNFLSKDQNTTIDIVNNLNPNYTMGLDKPYIVLSNTISTVEVSASSKPSRKTNGVSITANLNTVPSGDYKIQTDIGFSKNKKRILAAGAQTEELPDYFTISYEPPVKFFVGTDAEIAAEYKKITENSNNNELNSGDIVAIVFSILGFIIIVGGFCWFWKHRGRKGQKRTTDYQTPGDIMASPLSTVKTEECGNTFDIINK